jgi:hypothetical protein
MAKSPAARALAEPVPSPADTACSAADALCRAAAECARQHDRLGRCLELACSDGELDNIIELATLTDQHLDAMTDSYESMATAAPESKSTEWFHAANTLWHASREYARRNAGTNHASRLAGKHSKDKLHELALEYELERSALMALKQAVADYSALRKPKA